MAYTSEVDVNRAVKSREFRESREIREIREIREFREDSLLGEEVRWLGDIEDKVSPLYGDVKAFIELLD